MTGVSFSQVNTAISVREASFLTASQYAQLLQAADAGERALVLRDTAYVLDERALKDVAAIERVLMDHLLAQYAWAFEVSPDPTPVALFSLKYTYHNLKVFLKHRATGLDLRHLLIAAGPYPLEQLEHLASAFSGEYCPDFMLADLLETWQEYQDYRDLRVLEVGMDLAYFSHLRRLGETAGSEELRQLALLLIDCYNAVTAKRAHDQKKPHSFMAQLLSEEGSLSSADWIELAEHQDYSRWFSRANPQGFDMDLCVYEDRMADGTITALDLEYLADLVQVKLLAAARFETEGPLPLARYLLGKELEVKNLRLLLTGLDNGLPREAIRERMRPIYGEDQL